MHALPWPGTIDSRDKLGKMSLSDAWAMQISGPDMANTQSVYGGIDLSQEKPSSTTQEIEVRLLGGMKEKVSRLRLVQRTVSQSGG